MWDRTWLALSFCFHLVSTFSLRRSDRWCGPPIQQVWERVKQLRWRAQGQLTELCSEPGVMPVPLTAAVLWASSAHSDVFNVFSPVFKLTSKRFSLFKYSTHQSLHFVHTLLITLIVPQTCSYSIINFLKHFFHVIIRNCCDDAASEDSWVHIEEKHACLITGPPRMCSYCSV